MFLDLGTAPPSNAYLTAEQLSAPETYYPLQLYVCDACWLVQLPAHLSATQTFTSDYAYFSSYSESWVAHARAFVNAAVDRLGLDRSAFVAEVASNDGYLLQHVRDRGIRCLGIEPTASTAAAARARGIETAELFLGARTGADVASLHGRADLLVANNVLAHVPDLHDFIDGLRALLSPSGSLTIEFPHLLRLIEGVQFDTVYHEHYSYFSLDCAVRALGEHGLHVYDCEELPTHGGSLRLWVKHQSGDGKASSTVGRLLDQEKQAGLQGLRLFEEFEQCVHQIKAAFLSFLLRASAEKKTVVGYGAAAKGNTLLNYCGVRRDLMRCVGDANPAKQGRYLPGSRIPIVAPDAIDAHRPDYVVVLPWNLRQEIETTLESVRTRGGQFVYAVPELSRR